MSIILLHGAVGQKIEQFNTIDDTARRGWRVLSTCIAPILTEATTQNDTGRGMSGHDRHFRHE